LQVFQRSHPITTREPSEVIVHGPGGEISVGQFLAHAVALSKQLPDHGYIINLAADRYTFFLGFCAAMIAGQCTLMPPNRLQQTVQQVADEYADCYSFDETGPDTIEQFDGNIDALVPDTADLMIPEIPDQQLCAIAFTSGSTGIPSPNLKYWRTIRVGSLSNVELLIDEDVGPLNLIATVPPQHMWGFETSILLPLFSNVAVSHYTPFFPQDIADALESLPEPRAIVSSPVHLDALLKADVGRIKIDRIFSATAPMSADLAQELEQRFDARVSEVFGCSEAGTFATRSTASESLWKLSRTFTLDVGEDRTWIRASHLPETVVLQDIVELVGDDRFRWLGRQQDMVNIAGKRGSLADLNHRLNSIPGVIDGVIFMPDESSKRLAALVVAPGFEPSDILEQLKPGMEPAFLPRPVYIVPMLPRQETGKLARKMLVELFQQTRRSKTQKDEGPADNTG
jgi:acyl-coenzyme A synthetase/AMP-(fatty) acid ligase